MQRAVGQNVSQDKALLNRSITHIWYNAIAEQIRSYFGLVMLAKICRLKAVVQSSQPIASG